MTFSKPKPTKGTMKTTTLIIALIATASLAVANPGRPDKGRAPEAPGLGPMEMFTPEMVMKARGEIGLTDAQSSAIRDAIQRTQGEVTGIQWDMGIEMQKLHGLVNQGTVDEEAAAAQLDRVLALEAKVKKAHLRLALRIKSELTAEQQAVLRAKHFPRPPAPPLPPIPPAERE